MFKRNRLINTLLLNGLVSLFCSTAWAAQTSSTTCASALESPGESIGTLPITQPGTLLTNAQEGVSPSDFYKYTAPPGTLLKILLKPKILPSPLLESPPSNPIDPLFIRLPEKMTPVLNILDSDCTAVKTGSSYDTTAQVVLTVPDDGILIVSASSYGLGGDYKLITKTTYALGSITGTVIDSVTKAPLAHSLENYAFAQLSHCDNTKKNCQYIASGQTDEEGKITWNTEEDGTPLEAGFYQITAASNQYEPKTSAVFAVTKDTDKSVTVAAKSYPVRVTTTNCTVPSKGGVCQFSVTVTTSQPKVSATAWGIVEGNNINHLGQRTQFPLPSQSVTLSAADNTKILDYQFNVPANVQDGAYICPNIYVGGLEADSGFDIKGTGVFCIMKGDTTTGFTVVPQDKMAKIQQQMISPLSKN